MSNGPSPSIEFRPAQPADAEAIYAIYESWFGAEFCTWNREYPTRENIADDLALGVIYCLCDESGIVAVGTVRPWPEHDRLAAWHSAKPCDLMRIAVRRNVHSRGLGKLLLENLIAVSREKGFTGMRILVAKKNLPAIKLYKAFGAIYRGDTWCYDTDWFCYEILYKE